MNRDAPPLAPGTVARTAVPLPPEVRDALARARRLSGWTLAWMTAVSALMFAAMGGSQAMQTALVEDVLSLLPSIAFLLAARFRAKGIDGEFTNGRERAFDITFLVAAVALAGVGLLLVIDALHVLLAQEKPQVGTVRIAGREVWQGWLMIGALAVSAVPPVVLGRRKERLAKRLAIKSLHTDADVSKADWMTAVAGIAGVAGIGLGFWWADAAAALVIAGSVLRDGGRNLRGAMRDMHDARPETPARGDPDPLVDAVRAAVQALPWVDACRVRLHEEGMRLSGVVEVDAAMLDAARVRAATEAARGAHWRVDSVTVTLRDDGVVASPPGAGVGA